MLFRNRFLNNSLKVPNVTTFPSKLHLSDHFGCSLQFPLKCYQNCMLYSRCGHIRDLYEGISKFAVLFSISYLMTPAWNFPFEFGSHVQKLSASKSSTTEVLFCKQNDMENEVYRTTCFRKLSDDLA